MSMIIKSLALQLHSDNYNNNTITTNNYKQQQLQYTTHTNNNTYNNSQYIQVKKLNNVYEQE